MRRIIEKATIIFLPCLFVIFIGCGKKSGYQRVEGMIWNTIYHITYKGPSELQDSILPVLNEVGKSLSVFDRNSLVSQLNEADSIMTDGHLQKIYETSVKINRLSKGNFDPTVSPLVDAWGFGIGHTPTADTLAIDSILNFIGIEKTGMREGYIYKNDPRIRFNFSAIAKGYGCDAVGEMFRRNGVNDYMVEIGGELTLRGKSPSGKDWKIAIDAPVENAAPGEEAAMVISLTDAGVATSGNYRNYREEEGRKTAHTISPVTGRPFFSEILSATVVAPTCMEADGIATACMAGTLSEAMQLLEDTKTEGVLILGDTVIMTKGFPKQ